MHAVFRHLLSALVASCAVINSRSATDASELRLFTVNDGDAKVRQWSATSGAFMREVFSLTDAAVPFQDNSDIAADNTYFYSIRFGDARVRQWDRKGRFLADKCVLTDPRGQARDQIGIATDGQYFYTIARGDARVRKFSLAGAFIADVGVLTSPQGQVTDQTAIATDGEYFYTIASGDARVRKFDLSCKFIDDFAVLTESGSAFTAHTGLAVFTRSPTAAIHVARMRISWDADIGKRYQVQYRSILTGSSWIDVGSPTTGDDEPVSVLDEAPELEPQRFYRIVTLP